MSVNRQKTNEMSLDSGSSFWLTIFLISFGILVGLPWLAPLFMHLGWEGAGKALYTFYSYFCHQLPERSFFFFGQKTMYSLSEIQTAWQNTNDFSTLRKFIGNSNMGWKVAWSDRMISFYTSLWAFAVLWRIFHRKVKPLKWWGFTLLLLPFILDVGSHMISDSAGIGLGFRDGNLWLVTLTNTIFPVSFYAGDALGSFNSWMRLITGPLAALGIIWLIFPLIFQASSYHAELDNLNYAKIIEQLKNKSRDPSG